MTVNLSVRYYMKNIYFLLPTPTYQKMYFIYMQTEWVKLPLSEFCWGLTIHVRRKGLKKINKQT